MTSLATAFHDRKWRDVAPMVVALLNDELEGDRLYSPEQLIIWWNQAQAHLSSIKPMQKAFHYTKTVVKDKDKIPLPSDLYRPLYIIAPNTIYDRVTIKEGLLKKQPGFYVFNKLLYFTGSTIPTDFWLLYQSFYPDVEDNESIVTVPTWALEACAMYTAMLVITGEATKDARYRRYLTRTDSGNPQQNPFIPIVEWLERRFYQVVNAHSDDDVEFIETMVL